MIFVYTCREGEDEELRYSIRSVLKSFPEADIWLFGGKPGWYQGNFIPVKNVGNKFENILECYKSICSTKEIDDFIFMNDDFFILDNPGEIKYYYDGTIEDKIERHVGKFGRSKYSSILLETRKLLIKRGIKNPLNYDVHMPMPYNREKLSSIINLSFAPRSMYGNIFAVGGEKIEDVKVYKGEIVKDISGLYLSTEDKSFIKIKSLIEEKFPDKTDYELF